MPKITEPNEIGNPIFSNDQIRVLFLDSNEGSVACRIHGQIHSSTLPRLSEYSRVECATRSLLRMNNLAAVRSEPGSSMIGPADYFGNVEKPNQHTFSIDIIDGKPMMYRHPLEKKKSRDSKQTINDSHVTKIKGKWVSHTDPSIHNKLQEYQQPNQPVLGNSIFPESGILEVDNGNNGDQINLKLVNALDLDLFSFKARLVPNNEPFQITDENLPATDEYRAVSYMYEPGYTKNQVEKSGGLFLESHSFAQTMTPLDENAGGYVTLARKNEHTDELEIIAFKIPLGFTLIVEKNCIHGDATFLGMYMMCMTSNHTTMQTADSVFLKNKLNKKNIAFNAQHDTLPIKQIVAPEKMASTPLVLYYRDNENGINKFLETTKDMNFIFNPFSAGFIKRGTTLLTNWVNDNSIALEILGGFIAAIGTAAVIIGFAALNSVTFGTVGIAVTLIGLGMFTARAISNNSLDLSNSATYASL
jgi:hypothetical protein